MGGGGKSRPLLLPCPEEGKRKRGGPYLGVDRPTPKGEGSRSSLLTGGEERRGRERSIQVYTWIADRKTWGKGKGETDLSLPRDEERKRGDPSPAKMGLEGGNPSPTRKGKEDT